MPDETISVFISYSHDSPQHEARVLALADRLRADGIDAMIDQYQTAPPEGWQLWMEKQIRDARFVLLVCTETYLRRVMKEDAGKGLGVMWESSIIYSHLYSAGVVNDKFIPIVFDRADAKHIPTPLQPTTYYFVGDDAGYESLYRRLTDQPTTPAAPLGKLRALSPRERAITQSPNHQLAPNLVHPYALQANFTGRKQERAELTEWLADDAHPICALVAMGGMGKSALAWYWLTKDVLASPPIPTLPRSAGEGVTPPSPVAAIATGEGTGMGVLWWSFYEGEASFAKFIDDALKYVSGQPIDTTRLPTTYDRAQELRRELQSKRVLFVLDGFERQLRAYARLDAAYQRDDATESSREARACVDPIAARLLRDLAAGTTRAKVLITSRLMVSDLEDRVGDPLVGVHYRELKALARDDAIAFMRAQGVKQGTPAEIAAVCEAYGNHPLSLRLLSGLIARDARTPGDIAAAPRHDVHAELVARQHHVLEQSYNALPEKERALLSRIAAFRSAMTYDALAIFNEFGNEAAFDAALNDLQARGLIQRDTARNRYDLHPIVRHYAYDRLTDKTGVHTRLRDYFAKIPVPNPSKVQSIEDLGSVIELYHHTVRMGQCDGAREFLSDRLFPNPLLRLGAYETSIELLRALFPDGENHPPQLKNEGTQKWTVSALAVLYALSGQPRRSISLFEGLNEMDRQQGRQLAVNLRRGNIAYGQIMLGELAAAGQNLSCVTDMSVGDHQESGRLFAYQGAFDEAMRELDLADTLAERASNYPDQGLNNAYRTLRALLMSDADAAIKAAREAHVIAMRYHNERECDRAEWLLGAALVMKGKDLNAAATHLTEALTRCRRINLVELEPDILLAWARWHRARGNTQEAQAHAEEALAIADRCEYRLKQAEIHNFLARWWMDEAVGRRHAKRAEGSKSTSVAEALAEAKKHTEIAKERAWCDGPPHCYKPALDEAERMLERMKA